MSQILVSKKVTIAAGQGAAATLKAVNAAADNTLYIGRLVGIATGTKSGTSQYGEWTSLIGEFVKTDAAGEVSAAPQAFMPDVVLMPIVSALKAGGGAVNVAVDVFACADENSPVGFSYKCRSVIPETEDSPLKRLMALAAGTAVPALAAPAKNKKA